MGFSVRVWLVGILLAAPLGAFADTPTGIPTPLIGVIDIDEIQQDSLAAKAVRVQAEKYRQDFQQQGSAEEAALHNTQQAIEQERKTLTQQELADKAHAFDASVAEFQRRQLARRRAFEKSFNVAMGKIQAAMIEATRQVATAHGANIVLPRGQVILYNDNMNLTKEIIALMDKALPNVDFPPPQLDPDTPSLLPQSAQAPAVKKKN